MSTETTIGVSGEVTFARFFEVELFHNTMWDI